VNLREVDEGTRGILERYGFDADAFERLSRLVAAGELSAGTNLVRGTIEPPGPRDLTRVPARGEAGYDEARIAGAGALARGEVAVAVLNGGMATRFGGAVKGALEALDGRSFLEWKLIDAAAASKRVGAEIPFLIMNSFATDDATRAHVAERGRGLPAPHFFSQFVSLRMNPDGSLFVAEDGTASPYGPGHGDFNEALRSSGLVLKLRERGIRTVQLSNVDNLGARVDPVVIGVHLLGGWAMTVEVTAKEPGDKGGSPARVDGRVVVVEGFRYPHDFDQDRIPVFNTNSFVFDLDALDKVYPLSWWYVEKEVGSRTAVQLERLVNELSAFVPTGYLEVPRTGPGGRFVPVKTREDLAAAAGPLREILSADLFD
jgi:UTP--glucose-1-phosphate uridylyltransferase